MARRNKISHLKALAIKMLIGISPRIQQTFSRRRLAAGCRLLTSVAGWMRTRALRNHLLTSATSGLQIECLIEYLHVLSKSCENCACKGEFIDANTVIMRMDLARSQKLFKELGERGG